MDLTTQHAYRIRVSDSLEQKVHTDHAGDALNSDEGQHIFRWTRPVVIKVTMVPYPLRPKVAVYVCTQYDNSVRHEIWIIPKHLERLIRQRCIAMFATATIMEVWNLKSE